VAWLRAAWSAFAARCVPARHLLVKGRPVAQTKSTQSNPGARRGGSVATSARGGRGSTVAARDGGAAPVLPLAGGRGRRTGNPFAGTIGFIRDVRSELRKVAWPTSRETVNLTVVVIALSVAMGVFLGGGDFIFQKQYRNLIELTSGDIE